MSSSTSAHVYNNTSNNNVYSHVKEQRIAYPLPPLNLLYFISNKMYNIKSLMSIVHESNCKFNQQ